MANELEKHYGEGNYLPGYFFSGIESALTFFGKEIEVRG